jgi:hypothetical protein
MASRAREAELNADFFYAEKLYRDASEMLFRLVGAQDEDASNEMDASVSFRNKDKLKGPVLKKARDLQASANDMKSRAASTKMVDGVYERDDAKESDRLLGMTRDRRNSRFRGR